MGKRQSAKASRPRKAAPVVPAETPPVDEGQSSFLVRLESDLHAKLKETADQAGISMNQLVRGILHGVIDRVVMGEPDIAPTGFVSVRPTRQCVFFGRAGVFHHDHDRAEARERWGMEMDDNDPGQVWFGLDFTNRGVVRYQSK